jgi:shikimate kinase
MGSGKSTVGRLLARELGWEFLDMDHGIEERLGLSVAEVFARRGEAAFREEEGRLAEELAGRDRLVVAAGGGAFARPETRQALRRQAVTVWLRCDLATALARIPPDGTRPLAGSRATIGALFSERESSYGLADFSVNASDAVPEDVARRVLEGVLARRGTTQR